VTKEPQRGAAAVIVGVMFQLPAHQSSALPHSSTGVFIPSMMDSLMPGTDKRNSVRIRVRQSSLSRYITQQASSNSTSSAACTDRSAPIGSMNLTVNRCLPPLISAK
jgi:hypothetical protein